MSTFGQLRLRIGGILVAVAGMAAEPAAPKEAPPDPGLQVVPKVEPDKLPANRMLLEICEEGIPADNAWAPKALEEQESYEADTFGFANIQFSSPHI